MLPIDDLIRSLNEVVDHHGDHRTLPATNRSGIYPGIDVSFKPLLERISTGIGMWCLIHQHTHRVVQVAIVHDATIKRPDEEIIVSEGFTCEEPDEHIPIGICQD